MSLHDILQWIKPEKIIEVGGAYAPYIVMAVIFAETGLLVGFFFPGDSLLFTIGLLIGTDKIDFNIVVMLIGVFLAAVIGNTVGYAFGKSVGPRLFKKEDSLLFKKKYLDMTQSFYDRHGRMAIIAGRFLPIIRTFVPVLAGAIQLDFKKFTAYNIIGGLAWTASFILIGYFLGSIFPDTITKNLDYIVIGLIVITIIPVIRTYMKERKRARLAEESSK